MVHLLKLIKGHLGFSDYEFLADILETEDPYRAYKEWNLYRKLLDCFAETLINAIKPDQLIPGLRQRGCIFEVDRDKILATQTHHGPRKAALVLLDCIPQRRKDWFHIFITLLKETGYEEVVSQIEPLFMKAGGLG